MIPVNRPDIPFSELPSAWLSNVTIRNIEALFSEYLGGNTACLFTASGKIAGFLLFKFLGLTGSVITSPLACGIALKPVLANGLQLRFADVDTDSFNLSAEGVEFAWSEDAKAILAVHLGGAPCDLAALRKIADRRGMVLIEDCAQALGSEYRGIKVGSFGDHSVFSFAKTMWLGGGGMICSRDRALIKKIREYQDTLNEMPMGLLRYRFMRDAVESVRGGTLGDILYKRRFLKKGKNANVNIDIDAYFRSRGVLHGPSRYQAKMVAWQLKGIEQRNANRKANAHRLSRMLGNAYHSQKVDMNAGSVYSKFYITSPFDNRLLLNYLVSKGVDAKHLTKSHGIYFQPRFDGPDEVFSKSVTLPACRNYFDLHDHIVTLPISSKMKEGELDYMANVLNRFGKGSHESIRCAYH